MNDGLTDRDIQTVYDILNKYPEVKKVWLIGSRATGNYQKGSDIDLAIMNEGVSEKTIRSIVSDFEESTLPYFVDIINYPKLQHPGLKEHIEKIGKLFFNRDTVSVLQEKKAKYKKG